MEIKKITQLSLLLITFGLLFAGCTAEEINSDIKVETDDTNTLTEDSSVNETAQIEETVDEELITNDDEVELGDLI